MRLSKRLRVSIVFAAFLCTLAAGSPAFAADEGALRLVTGEDGCFQQASALSGQCRDANGLGHAAAVEISPDGQHVYTAGQGSYFESFAVFARTTSGDDKGELTQVGCFNDDGTDGCVVARGMPDPIAVAVSPDNQTVYVLSHNYYNASIATFRWVGSSLVQLSGADGCMANTWYVGLQGGCAPARSFYYLEDLDVTPDGETLYTGGQSTLHVLDRDPGTGALSQDPGLDGCFDDAGGNGCRDGRALSLVTSVEATNDNVYATAHGSAAVATFDRGADGDLTQPAGIDGCIDQQASENCLDGRALQGARDLVLSPDGTDVYVASRGSDAVARLYRRADGTLRQAKNRSACFSTNGKDPEGSTSGRCLTARGLQDATALAIAPDGTSLYAFGTYDNALAAFERAPDGDLRRLTGPDHCTTDSGDLPDVYHDGFYHRHANTCQSDGNAAELLDGEFGDSLALSGDGEHLYVAATFASANGSEGALSIWSRTTGAAAGTPEQMTWDLGQDFRTGARRGDDAYEQADVWEYEQLADDGNAAGRSPSEYTRLNAERPDDAAFEQDGYENLPVLYSDGAQATTHPDFDDASVIRWRNPTGNPLTVALNLQLSDANAGCGDGVRWFLDKGFDTDTSATPALPNSDGTIPNGDEADRIEDILSLAAGESLYLVVAPIGNHYCDTTDIDLRITGPVVDGPQTSIDDGPEGTVSTATPAVSFSSDVTSAAFECESHREGQVPGTWTACTSPRSLNLTDGDWVFRVRAIDGLEIDPTPARRRFTVDTTPPVVTFTQAPGATTRDRSPRFTFTVSEPTSELTCRLDQAAFAPCSSPIGFDELADGSHTFELKAADQFGNAAATASRTFTVTTAPTGGQVGALSQLPGTAGCIAHFTPPYGNDLCAQGRGIHYANGSDVSPDGEHLYVTAGENSTLTVFDRDAATGALAQKPGAAGCVYRYSDPDCRSNVFGLAGANSVAVSPNGQNVYVSSWNDSSVLVFDRAADGTVTPKTGTAGCVGPASGGCAPARALTNAVQVVVAGGDNLASSADDHVYVIAESSSSVLVFDVAADGSLTQKSGRDGCYSDSGSNGECRNARQFDQVAGGAVAPDGENLYVTSWASDSTAAFAIRPDGSLRQLSGEDGCADDQGSENCRDTYGTWDVRGVVVSPDNRNVYVSAGDGIAVLSRNARGGLVQSDDPERCIWNYDDDGCRKMRAGNMDGLAIEISPDGRNLYAMDGLHSDSLVVLRRDSEGGLEQLSGRDGCWYEGGANGACHDGRGLGGWYGADALTLSPDGRNVYLTGRDYPGTIAVFARAVPEPLTASPPMEWDAYRDFDPDAPGSNPRGDRYGNAGVWEYLKVAANGDGTDRFSSTYTRLTNFDTGNERRAGFYDTDGSFWLGSGISENLDRFFMHPERASNGGESAVTRWTAPLSGSHVYRVQGLVEDEHYGGDGVIWYLDRRTAAGTRSNVASGVLTPGGRSHEIEETLTLAQGDSLELVLSPRSGYDSDSTWVDLHITGDAAERGPQTVLGAAPRGRINDDTPAVAFSSATGGASFECSVDGAAFAACANDTGFDLGPLTEGAHTFAVRARSAGVEDPTPEATRFTVDTVKPTIQIVSGPTGVTRDPAASFTWTASEPGAIECRVDKVGVADEDTWEFCPSPYLTSELADGPHTIEVRSRDRANNVSTVASRGYTVDTGAESLQPGALAQLPTDRGCVSQSPATDNCTPARATDGVTGTAISADGRFVYATAYDGDAITVHQRTQPGAAGAGKLTPLAGEGGCITRTATADCATGRFMDGIHALEIVGSRLYALARESSAIVVFSIDPDTGAIAQLPGAAGCYRHDSTEGGQCTSVRAIPNPHFLAASADGENLYVASYSDGGYVTTFNIGAAGALAQPVGLQACFSYDGRAGCTDARALNEPHEIAVAPDGGAVYVASVHGWAVLSLKRDPDTGVLTQPAGEAGCISYYGDEGCADGREFVYPRGIAVSADSSKVYATSDYHDTINVLDVQPDGGLLQAGGPAGCVDNTGESGCADADGLAGPTTAIVSRDGHNLYVGSIGSDTVTAFAINQDDGTLRQLSGADACVGNTSLGGRCRDGKALNLNYGPVLVESPDGLNVYAGVRDSDAIANFARKKPAPAEDSPVLVWDLARDYRRAPDHANPSSDRFGNADVWSYQQDTGGSGDGATRAPAGYSLLTDHHTDNRFGVQYVTDWYGRADGAGDRGFPFAGVSGYDRFDMHPAGDAHQANSVVGWRNPLSQTVTVNVSGLWEKIHPGTDGDGIQWFVDHGAANLRSGTIAPQGAAQSFDLTEEVGPGEQLWFYLARRSNNSGDGAYLDLTISSPTVAGPPLETLTETGPQTTITSAPRAVTTAKKPSIAFTAKPADNATFECKVDGDAWSDCSSPFQPASDLADGTHTVRVRGTLGGATDPTPASRTFRVDTSVPSAVIDSGPEGLTRDRTPRYEFSMTSAETGSFFECRLDSTSAAAWQRCSSPVQHPELVNGSHTFDVRVVDRAGNTSAPAHVDIDIDLSPAGLQFGGLTQLPGTAACTSDTGTGGACVDGRRLDGISAAAITPDGETVYTAGYYAHSIGVFTRSADGSLIQKDGAAGCVSNTGADGCSDARALAGLEELIVSPDGDFLYAAARNSYAIAVFAIAADGTLSQAPGAAGCIQRNGGEGCADADGKLGAPYSLEFGPGAQELYSASADQSTVVALDRDATTGALSFNSCIGHNGSDGCASVDHLGGPLGLEVVGDDVYVSTSSSSTVLEFDRAGNGSLSPQRCLSYYPTSGCTQTRRIGTPYEITASPDGEQLYLADQYEDALTILDRDATNGALLDLVLGGRLLGRGRQRGGRHLPERGRPEPATWRDGRSGRQDRLRPVREQQRVEHLQAQPDDGHAAAALRPRRLLEPDGLGRPLPRRQGTRRPRSARDRRLARQRKRVRGGSRLQRDHRLRPARAASGQPPAAARVEPRRGLRRVGRRLEPAAGPQRQHRRLSYLQGNGAPDGSGRNRADLQALRALGTRWLLPQEVGSRQR